MKLIDTHVHFDTPGTRTQDAKNYLLQQGLALPGGDGEYMGLKKYMALDGVDVSVNAPVALMPEEAIIANRRTAGFDKKDPAVICLGAMHPDMDDPEKEVEYLSREGFKGIKMHPKEQDFYPDEDRLRPICRACSDKGLYIVFHAGTGGEPNPDLPAVKGTPERFSKVISAFPDLRIVLAHMGGFHMWEEAERHVLGKKIWIDTAYCTVMPDEKIKRIINIHGADRVLFGSDFPWQRASDIRKKLETSIENIRDREKIFYKNAEKLLGLDKQNEL